MSLWFDTFSLSGPIVSEGFRVKFQDKGPKNVGKLANVRSIHPFIGKLRREKTFGFAGVNSNLIVDANMNPLLSYCNE